MRIYGDGGHALDLTAHTVVGLLIVAGELYGAQPPPSAEPTHEAAGVFDVSHAADGTFAAQHPVAGSFLATHVVAGIF